MLKDIAKNYIVMPIVNTLLQPMVEGFNPGYSISEDIGSRVHFKNSCNGMLHYIAKMQSYHDEVFVQFKCELCGSTEFIELCMSTVELMV